jgi:alkaline phosphatase D
MVDKKLPFPDGELEQAFELGAVDHQSVRAWIREPDSASATVSLEVEGRDPVTETVAVAQEHDWTATAELRLSHPAPGQRFVCKWGEQQRTGRFAPLPGETSGMVFGFGSCNRPYTLDDAGEVVYNSASDIYALMESELQQEEAAFMILAGDQIYSDEIDPISVRTDLVQDPEDPPPLDQVINAYRRIYRGYYAHPGYKHLREQIPTMCIWDDHDIFDNWGSRLHESALDRQMFKAATHTYLEYQHLRNPGTEHRDPPFHFTFQYGDIGFFVLDVRGKRDYVENCILGPEQWDALENYLTSQEAQSIETLFIVSTIPVAHTARWMGLAFSSRDWGVADAVRDRWTSSQFLEQRTRLTNLLFDWQTAVPRRQVVILSGDVHVASAVTITRRNKPGVIQQFISSAITTPIETLHVVLHNIVTSGLNLFEPELRHKNHFLASENNYGLIRVTPQPSGGHEVELVVRGLDTKVGALKTVGHLLCRPE